MSFEKFGEIFPAEEKEKRDIQAIERLPLTQFDRMHLVLTYLGEKPVSLFEIAYSQKSSSEEIQRVLSRIEQIKNVLRK